MPSRIEGADQVTDERDVAAMDIEDVYEENPHKQVLASKAMVDEGLVTLLERVWANGIETQFSCQGGYEHPELHSRFRPTNVTDAHIVFPTFDEAVRFLQLSVDKLVTMSDSWWLRDDWSTMVDAMLCLKLVNPYPDHDGRISPDGIRRGQVFWPHDYTHFLTRAWSE